MQPELLKDKRMGNLMRYMCQGEADIYCTAESQVCQGKHGEIGNLWELSGKIRGIWEFMGNLIHNMCQGEAVDLLCCGNRGLGGKNMVLLFAFMQKPPKSGIFSHREIVVSFDRKEFFKDTGKTWRKWCVIRQSTRLYQKKTKL